MLRSRHPCAFCYFACLYCMFILWLFHFAFDKVLLKNFTTTTTSRQLNAAWISQWVNPSGNIYRERVQFTRIVMGTMWFSFVWKRWNVSCRWRNTSVVRSSSSSSSIAASEQLRHEPCVWSDGEKPWGIRRVKCQTPRDVPIVLAAYMDIIHVPDAAAVHNTSLHRAISRVHRSHTHPNPPGRPSQTGRYFVSSIAVNYGQAECAELEVE